MCERYSWIEKGGNVLFLTDEDVFDTERGKELQAYSKRREDWYGHGAIRFFFDLKGGHDRECSDFSSPANFPIDLVAAIKAGRMWRFGITRQMLCMLAPEVRAEYNNACSAASTKYINACSAARAEYEKACSEAWYEKACSEAWAEYNNARSAAGTKYLNACPEAEAERDKACPEAWVTLWKVKTNRVAEWR